MRFNVGPSVTLVTVQGSAAPASCAAGTSEFDMESDAETPAQPRASPSRCDQMETPAQRGPPTPPVLTFLGAPTHPGLHARVLCAPRRLGARAHGRSRSLAQAGPLD